MDEHEWPDNMPLDEQVERLASLLLDRFGGPTRSEGAIEMACRVLVEQADTIDHLLGVAGEDWRIVRYDEEYEGWAGYVEFYCVEEERWGGCICCDPRNLGDDHIAAIERATGKVFDDG